MRKKRRNNEETLGDAIGRLLKVYRLENRLEEVGIVNAWEEMMGSMIARHTREIYIRDRILYVRLNSSVLREELSYARSKLIAMVNEKAGRELIDDVDLR